MGEEPSQGQKTWRKQITIDIARRGRVAQSNIRCVSKEALIQLCSELTMAKYQELSVAQYQNQVNTDQEKASLLSIS